MRDDSVKYRLECRQEQKDRCGQKPKVGIVIEFDRLSVASYSSHPALSTVNLMPSFATDDA